MSDEDTTIDTKGLDQLIKALKRPAPSIRVGVLGSKTVRKNEASSALTNAEVGAAHEFGTSMLPQRSFLRVPIADNLDKEMDKASLSDKDALKEVIKTGSFMPWAQKVAVLAEGIVAEAFDTAGFGKWQPSNMARKALKQTLVETQQLRNSITSEVKE